MKTRQLRYAVFIFFTEKGVFEILQNFNNLAGLRPATTLLEKKLWHRCFPVNVMKFLKTPFSRCTSG